MLRDAGLEVVSRRDVTRNVARALELTQNELEGGSYLQVEADSAQARQFLERYARVLKRRSGHYRNREMVYQIWVARKR